MSGRILFALIAVAFTAIDLATKAWAYEALGTRGIIEVIPGFFDLRFVYNDGAAFGSFGGLDASVRLPLFYSVSAMATLVLIYFSWTAGARDWLYHVALGLILSGVLGNLYDRVAIGKVRDFLDFYVGDSHWPTFNVADAAIVVGAAYILVKFWRESPEAEKQPVGEKAGTGSSKS